jgi:hypothetical protein
MAINIEEANAAIEDLEARLSELGVPAEALSDVHSDIATIKVQCLAARRALPVSW